MRSIGHRKKAKASKIPTAPDTKMVVVPTTKLLTKILRGSVASTEAPADAAPAAHAPADAAPGPPSTKKVDVAWNKLGHGDAPAWVHTTLVKLHTAHLIQARKIPRKTAQEWLEAPVWNHRRHRVSGPDGVVSIDKTEVAAHPDVNLSKHEYRGRTFDVYTMTGPDQVTVGMINARSDMITPIMVDGIDIVPMAQALASKHLMDGRDIEPATLNDYRRMVHAAKGTLVFADTRVVAQKLMNNGKTPRCVVRAAAKRCEFKTACLEQALATYKSAVAVVEGKSLKGIRALSRGPRQQSVAQQIVARATALHPRLTRTEAYEALLTRPLRVWQAGESIPTNAHFLKATVRGEPL
jgi:hypothetical protein